LATGDRGMTVDRVAVVGAGTMGAQIAAQCALHNLSVELIESDPRKLEEAARTNHRHLMRRVEKGRLTEAELESTFGRIHPSLDIELAATAQIAIEAVFEDLAAKRDVFTQLAEICAPDAVLATNSSSIPISQIIHDLPYPDRACNIHFFHPVLIMRLVEIMRGPETSDDTVDAVTGFVRQIDREPVLIEKEISGMIVNRILGAIKREALWLASEGYATPRDIDRAVKLGLNHPMGPFELTDFSGLDVFYGIMLRRYQETGDEAWKPPSLLEDKVKSGELGRKTGRGFYDYLPEE
jgi:3-hydroxybutyryl-CoA dehydrogenase